MNAVSSAHKMREVTFSDEAEVIKALKAIVDAQRNCGGLYRVRVENLRKQLETRCRWQIDPRLLSRILRGHYTELGLKPEYRKQAPSTQNTVTIIYVAVKLPEIDKPY